MTRTNWGRLLVGCLLHFLLGVSFAADGGGSEWRHWVTTQVNAHPEIVAAREAMNAELAMADQLQRPIYNPELFGGYEREGDANNWRVGVGQIDGNGARTRQRRSDLDDVELLQGAAMLSDTEIVPMAPVSNVKTAAATSSFSNST